MLPAHVVVYFVMALALFRDGYDEVIRALVHGLRFARTVEDVAGRYHRCDLAGQGAAG